MALYETVFITRQDLTLQDVDKLSDSLSKVITDLKGKIVSKEYWGLRDLPYKIKKNLRGHYVLLNIDAPIEAINEVKRIMKHNENIIRNNIYTTQKHSDKPSQLMLSINAVDYKSGTIPKSDKKMDEIIDKIVINIT